MNRTYRILVGVLFGALSLFANVSDVEAQVPVQDVTCLPDVHFKGLPDAAAINGCTGLALFLAPGATLYVILEGRIYHIETQINVVGIEGAKVVVRGASCGSRPTLLAARNLGNQNIIRGQGSNYNLLCLIADGGKEARDYVTLIPGEEYGVRASHRLCSAEDWRPANIVIGGQNINLTEIFTVNAACGSGLGVVGIKVVIRFVRAISNGFEAPRLVVKPNGEFEEIKRDKGPGFSHQLSDGFTIIFCQECEISDCILEDNTDLAIALGGGAKNVVKNNHCIVKSVSALGCFNIGRFSAGLFDPDGLPWDGRHKDLQFYGNTVSTRDGLVTFGLSIGTYFYCSSRNLSCRMGVVHDAGTIWGNTVSGAKANVVVHGVETIVLVDNTIGEAEGEAPDFFLRCRVKVRYGVGFVKAGAVLQPGYERLVVDDRECK